MLRLWELPKPAIAQVEFQKHLAEMMRKTGGRSDCRARTGRTRPRRIA
jgi:hypothetical protein